MARRTTRSNTKPVELFVSYSHENAPWFGKLRPLLKFRRPTNVAHAWHDQELKAGDRWDDRIRAALDAMDVFVCLVSYEFLDSDYIMDVELKQALKREENGEIEIVPIVLYDVNLEEDCPELKPFNPLPSWDKCWLDYRQNTGHYQAAHKPIREGLRQAIDKVIKRR